MTYKNTRKKYFGHTWLGWLNLLILQWFFIRLAHELTENKWIILKWIVPCTGWNCDFIYIGKRT